MNEKLVEVLPKILWLISAWIVIYLFLDPIKNAINQGNIKAKFLEFEIEIESDEGEKDSVTLENFIKFIQDNNNILQGTDIQLRKAIDSLGKIVATNSRIYDYQPQLQSTESVEAVEQDVIKPVSNKKRILWVDDHPQNNILYVNRLQKSGYIVDRALNEHEAQTLLNAKKYHVVISDMGRVENGNKNNLQGIETISSVRQSGANKKVPVIIFTSGMDARSTAMDAGAFYMTNSGSDLILQVEKILNPIQP